MVRRLVAAIPPAQPRTTYPYQTFPATRHVGGRRISAVAQLRTKPWRSPDRGVSAPNRRTRGPPRDPWRHDTDGGGPSFVTSGGQGFAVAQSLRNSTGRPILRPLWVSWPRRSCWTGQPLGTTCDP